MERARCRNSRSIALPQANWKILKQRTASKLASDAVSSKTNVTERDMPTLDLEKNSSKRVTGIPIKKLMAEEMVKEVEVKRRSPSVIARLMGFSAPQFSQPVYKQSKISSNYYKKSITPDGGRWNARSRSNQKGFTVQQEFKDVYEDVEASHGANCHGSSKWKANSNAMNPEMTFNQQRIIDAKGLPSNRFQRSNEFYDASGMVDSNKLMHFSSSQCSRIAVLKPAYSANAEDGNPEGLNSVRENVHSPRRRSHWRREDGLLICSHDPHVARSSEKMSKVQSECEDVNGALPRRIIVLKPNLMQMDNSDKSVSYRKLKEHSDLSAKEHQSRKSSPRSQEARKIAREVTRQIREHLGRRSINLLCSGIRGYAGDESSCYLSGSDSASDLEALSFASRHSFDASSWERPSFNGSSATSVRREAKKKLPERLKTTHQGQEMEEIGRGSTLGEMLAIPDREVYSDNWDDMACLNQDIGRYTRSDGMSGWESPLGISSREGWKDEYVRNSCRSRSLPPLSLASQDDLDNDPLSMIRKFSSQNRSRSLKGSFNQKEDHSSRRLRSRLTSSHFACHSSGDSNTSPDSSEVLDTNNLNQKDSFDQQEQSTSVLGYKKTPVCDQDNYVWQEPSAGFSKGGAVLQQCAAPESESSESCKMADHPSPVSVLEVPCAEETTTSSECFQMVSAGLRELRKQLQLLKMESEGSAEEPVHVHAIVDKRLQKESFTLSEENEFAEPKNEGVVKSECWELSYLFRVLKNSIFDYMNIDASIASWDSPERPFGLWIFNNLEKYYGEQAELRAERKLLFDRVNSAMVELCQKFSDPCPRRKAKRNRGRMNLSKNGVIDELYKVLVDQEKNADIALSEQVLDQEMLWLDFEEHSDVGKEIEEMVINDLITEIMLVEFS